MLGNAGADFVDGFDFDIGYVFRQLFLCLEGSVFTGDFSFFRYEVYQVMDVDDVAGCKDAGMLVSRCWSTMTTSWWRMHSQPQAAGQFIFRDQADGQEQRIAVDVEFRARNGFHMVVDFGCRNCR